MFVVEYPSVTFLSTVTARVKVLHRFGQQCCCRCCCSRCCFLSCCSCYNCRCFNYFIVANFVIKVVVMAVVIVKDFKAVRTLFSCVERIARLLWFWFNTLCH